MLAAVDVRTVLKRGALVAAAWAAGLPSARLREELTLLRRQDFWDPAPGAGLLRGRLFRQRLEALLPVQRFEECRRPVAVSIFDLVRRRARAQVPGGGRPARGVRGRPPPGTPGGVWTTEC